MLFILTPWKNLPYCMFHWQSVRFYTWEAFSPSSEEVSQYYFWIVFYNNSWVKRKKCFIIFEIHAIFLHKSGTEIENNFTILSGSNMLEVYQNIVVIILKIQFSLGNTENLHRNPFQKNT